MAACQVDVEMERGKVVIEGTGSFTKFKVWDNVSHFPRYVPMCFIRGLLFWKRVVDMHDQQIGTTFYLHCIAGVALF